MAAMAPDPPKSHESSALQKNYLTSVFSKAAFNTNPLPNVFLKDLFRNSMPGARVAQLGEQLPSAQIRILES